MLRNRIEPLTTSKCHGGKQMVVRHNSEVCNCEMMFGIYLPPVVQVKACPVLWFLSGLTCTHESSMLKSGIQQYAARYGLVVVFPDTSPRGKAIPDSPESFLGQGAGFYVDATEEPWRPHYNMFSYITEELPRIIVNNFNVNIARQGITGHSMGGHGALTIAMLKPKQFMSLSAFAPVCNPIDTVNGRKQLMSYLGNNEEIWALHDASMLIRSHGWKDEILIDQGSDDIVAPSLCLESLQNAVLEVKQKATIRIQPGYDHSYFFVNTFIGEHTKWHADRLNA